MWPLVNYSPLLQIVVSAQNVYKMKNSQVVLKVFYYVRHTLKYTQIFYTVSTSECNFIFYLDCIIMFLWIYIIIFGFGFKIKIKNVEKVSKFSMHLAT